MKIITDQLVKYTGTIFRTFLVFILSSSLIPDAGASFFQGEPDKSVKIGLLIPDSKSVAAKQGAELAIRKANENGGLQGHPFRLVVRSMEGPWGTGSKQAVDLIFNEKVWALLGSHDGRNAHLVEQAATKSIVPFVSAWTGDPTLSQAFVPWFFNCVPNDIQQAEALAEEIYNKRRINKVITISDTDYDSNLAFSNFLKEIKLEQKADPLQFRYEDYSEGINEMMGQIERSDAGCIVLFCNPSVSLEIFRQIRQRKMSLAVFSSPYLLNENELSDQELKSYDNDLLFTAPKWSGPKYRDFVEGYQELYGNLPGIVAAYAYDGMNLLIEAIRNAGTSERELIQKSLEKICYEGVTGPISFDKMGNREGPYFVTMVNNGIPVISDK
jgi:branched-chain amino acid transport system substrate-binding protein